MPDAPRTSFIAELRQRKVFRVGLAYLVVAWVSIQAASIGLPAFGAPDWVLRVVILLFALGLPLALLLAWALDLTPDGVRVVPGRVGNKRMAGIAAALAALALAWYFLGQPALRRGASIPERSIAVLPFVNMSGDAANDYFSDGLAETTLDMLSQVRDLKVIARTSSFAFKGRNTDMREIGRALGAAHLLEGSVQQAGDTVRITVQLIRASDGSHLWSRHFDRRIADVFRIQDEIATAVVQALQVALPASERARLVQPRTASVAAYQEYLHGIALLPDRKIAGMRTAAAHFERAIALDPQYARAYVAAHDTYHLLAQYASVTPRERERARRYLDRALQLAPTLGEAHVARATALEDASRLVDAEREYRRGLDLAPGYASGWQWFGEFMALQYGRYDEALPMLQRAFELDPLSPVIRGVRLFWLAQAGRTDEALALADQLIAERPDVPRSYDDRSVVHQERGDMVASLADLKTQDRLAPAAVGFRLHRCDALVDLGALDAARACIDGLAALAGDNNDLHWARAKVALAEGDPARAAALLGSTRPPSERWQAWTLVQAGEDQAALAIYRRLLPELFRAAPTVYPGLAQDAMGAGIALMRTGDPAQGRRLLQAGQAALAGRPRAALIGGRGWLDVVAQAQLGNADAAFAALQDGVEGGYCLGLAELDANPLLAGLRRDPRYARILAPARARAGAQIDEARRRGLL